MPRLARRRPLHDNASFSEYRIRRRFSPMNPFESAIESEMLHRRIEGFVEPLQRVAMARCIFRKRPRP
jgi:hypothetical protein